MKIPKMEYFLSVARNLSFSKAAQECYLAQSAISQQIRGLERELGFCLFERNTRSVKLTDAGKSLYQDYTQAYQMMDAAEKRALAFADRTLGTLTIGLACSDQFTIVSNAVSQFHAAHPDINIRFELLSPKDKYRQLTEGLVDIAYDIVGHYDLYPSFRFPRKDVCKVCLIVGKDHPLANYKSVSRTMTLDYKKAIADVRMRDWMIKEYHQYFGSGNSYDYCFTSDYEMMFAMIASNLAISTLPENCKKWWSEEFFSFIELDDGFEIEMGWVCSTGNQNPLLQVFLEEGM